VAVQNAAGLQDREWGRGEGRFVGAAGPVVAGGTLFVGSGYIFGARGTPGNVRIYGAMISALIRLTCFNAADFENMQQ
jgi:hypothetical protein